MPPTGIKSSVCSSNARNCTFDAGQEATAISKDVLRKFFLDFVDFYANQVGPNVIEVPRTAEAIAECIAGYEVSGFPGFIGSVRNEVFAYILKLTIIHLLK